MTERLTQRQQRILRNLRWLWPLELIIGLCCLLLAVGYLKWGVDRFGMTGRSVLQTRAFDGPIAQIESLYAQRQEQLKSIQIHTELEVRLLKQLQAQTAIACGFLTLFLRFLIGSIFWTVGMTHVASAMTQKPLLTIIRALQEKR